MPTEIFRPGMRIPAPPRRVPPDPRAQPSRVPLPAMPAAMPPVSLTGLTGDDWDGETVVKRPAAFTSAKRREPKPFNPDETVNLHGEIGVDIDFSDETQLVGPPRRPR